MSTDKGPQSPTDPIRPVRNRIHYKNIVRERVVLPKKVMLDWKAYFIQFCQHHGEPVEHGNVLLFRDGWRYAMSYEGPEYAPPIDHTELDILVATYWITRRKTCNRMLTNVLAERDRLIAERGKHSLELLQVVLIDTGRPGATGRKKGAMPLDLRPLDERIHWLRDDIRECERELAIIEQFHKRIRTKQEVK